MQSEPGLSSPPGAAAGAVSGPDGEDASSASGRRTAGRAQALRWAAAAAAAVVVAGAAAGDLQGASEPPLPHPAPQGRAEGYDPAAENARCEGCHTTIAAEWRGSLHRQSWEDGVFRTAYALEPLAFCRGCHAPEADAAKLPGAAERALGVGCVTCHVQGGEVLGVKAHGASGDRHAVRADARLAGASACGGCHQFGFPLRPTSPMQGTNQEHQAGRMASTPCQDCHMPAVKDGAGRSHRSHTFKVLGDAAMLRSAVKATAVRGAEQAVTVTLEAGKVGFAAEASLPVRGLPRTLQAPVEHFTGYAAAVRGPTPPASPTAEPVWFDTPAPVGFEPHAELRASVFQQAQRRLSYSGYKPFGISYQPGDDLEVEDCLYVGGDSQVVGTERKILYSKQMTMGDLEVGYAYTGTAGPSAAVLTSAISLHKGKPVGTVDLFGEPKGIVQRDGEVHVITYLLESFVDSPGESGEWSAVAFGPDGAPREEIVERAPRTSWGFLSVVESSAPDFSTFGLSAVTMSDQHVPGDTVELTWTYDKKERLYRVSVKEPSAAGPKKSSPKKK